MSCTGFDGSLAIGSADATLTATGTWTAVGGSKDVNATISSDKADTSTRNSVFKNYIAAGLDCEISATVQYDSTDTTHSTIRTACLARTRLTVACLDGAVAATSQGLAFDGYVFSNDIAQPLSEGQTYSVTFKPAEAGTVPTWVTLV